MQEKLIQISKLKLESCITSSEKERYQIINKILEDKECFKKMKTATAYNLLSDLGFNEIEIKKIYNEIIFNNL